MRTYVGIDNGTSAGIAILKPGEEPHVLLVPSIDIGGRTYLDIITLRNILRKLDDAFVAVEQTQIQPKFGGRTNHSQGRAEGGIDALLRLMPLPHQFVPPKTWQSAMLQGIRKAGQDTKSAALDACSRLFPNVSLVPPRCRVPDHNLADGLLIGEWARRQNL